MTMSRRQRRTYDPQSRRQAVRRLEVCAAVAVAALALAACSSGPTSSTTTTSTNSTTTTIATTTTTTTVVPTTLPSLSVSTTDIEHAYSTLFDLANPAISPKLLVVQDGSALTKAFTVALHSALAKEAAGAKVDTIKIEQGATCTKEFLPSPCAAVTYDILGPSGKPVLTGSSGGAVYLRSRWLVAKSTICTLLTLDNGGTTPSGC